MEVKLSGHGIYRVEYHVCWITKYRRRILNPGVESYLRKLFPKILRLVPEVEILTVGIDDRDHVHLVMVIPPKYAVSAVIAQIKSQSSSRLRKKKFENFLKQLGDSPKKKRNISANVCVYEKFRRHPYYFSYKEAKFG